VDYRWRIADQPDDATVGELALALHQPQSIARILVTRGITHFDEARRFFRPNLADLHDPFLMKDMDIAVACVARAIGSGAHIRVYGDYDVDGTTSAGMLYRFLVEAGAHASYYIPDRFTEGYGLSFAGVETAHREEVRLLITVDCGTTAVAQIARARELGMDVIVCDHHEPDAGIPSATALLNPIQPGCTYPFKYLSGCGVAFKLMQGLSRMMGIDESHCLRFLDFVAIAAAADIVPLVGENRILAAYGLQLLNGNPRPGFRALLEAAGVSAGTLQSSAIVFNIAPRINAAGRIGNAMRAVRLMLCDDPVEAQSLAQELEIDNRSRRVLDEETFAAAQEMIEQTLNRSRDRIIVLHGADWHPGVIGIVASRVAEKYYLPAVMLSTINGIAKGSARSIPGFDIHHALRACESLMLNFGGHKYAAGLSLTPEHVPALRDALNENARSTMSPEMLIPEITADTNVGIPEISPTFVNVIKQFAPFGPRNMRPVFHISNVEVVGTPRIVGNNHLKFRVREYAGVPKVGIPKTNGNGFKNQERYNHTPSLIIDAIGFGLGNKLSMMTNGRKQFEMLAAVDENIYNGKTTTQFLVKDIR